MRQTFLPLRSMASATLSLAGVGHKDTTPQLAAAAEKYIVKLIKSMVEEPAGIPPVPPGLRALSTRGVLWSPQQVVRPHCGTACESMCLPQTQRTTQLARWC